MVNLKLLKKKILVCFDEAPKIGSGEKKSSHILQYKIYSINYNKQNVYIFVII